PNPELSFSGNLLYMITGKEPSPAHEQAMDVSLILYAEHEFNASTFTARVVTSTQSDLYSAITAAIGAFKSALAGGADEGGRGGLKGLREGGENEGVVEVVSEVASPEVAEEWVRDALAKKRRIMGFGHRVYKDGDPRAVILREHCRKLADESGSTDLEQIAD